MHRFGRCVPNCIRGWRACACHGADKSVRDRGARPGDYAADDVPPDTLLNALSLYDDMQAAREKSGNAADPRDAIMERLVGRVP